MFGTKQTQRGLAETVAAARDEALMEIGREAAARQQLRQTAARRSRAGAMVAATLAAGAALAAGAVVYHSRKRRNGKEVLPSDPHPGAGNGIVSEHEHQEEAEDEPVASKR